jgi:hypothetical protein
MIIETTKGNLDEAMLECESGTLDASTAFYFWKKYRFPASPAALVQAFEIAISMCPTGQGETEEQIAEINRRVRQVEAVRAELVRRLTEPPDTERRILCHLQTPLWAKDNPLDVTPESGRIMALVDGVHQEISIEGLERFAGVCDLPGEFQYWVEWRRPGEPGHLQRSAGTKVKTMPQAALATAGNLR